MPRPLSAPPRPARRVGAVIRAPGGSAGPGPVARQVTAVGPTVAGTGLIMAGLVVATVLTGCSGTPDDATSAPPAVEAPRISAAPPVDEPPGTTVCGKAVDAVRGATLMNPGVVTDIAAAAGTADAPVADAAQELSGAYTKAVAARGTDDEPDAVAAVSAAAAELVEVCGDSGLETAG